LQINILTGDWSVVGLGVAKELFYDGVSSRMPFSYHLHDIIAISHICQEFLTQEDLDMKYDLIGFSNGNLI
jgi:hypothetical protein